MCIYVHVHVCTMYTMYLHCTCNCMQNVHACTCTCTCCIRTCEYNMSGESWLAIKGPFNPPYLVLKARHPDDNDNY